MATDIPNKSTEFTGEPAERPGEQVGAETASSRPPESQAASGKTGPAAPDRGGQVVSSVRGTQISPETQKKLFPVAISATALFGWILMMAFVLIGFGLLIGLLRGPVHTVQIVQPQPETLTDNLRMGGQVVGATEVVVGTQTTGTVQQLFVKQGDRVKAGQQLAVVNVYPSQDAQTQAQQQADRANDKLSQLEIQSGTPDTTSHSTLAGARTWLHEQQAQLAQAKQKLAQRQTELRQAEAAQDRAQKRILGSVAADYSNNELKDADQRVAMAKENLHEAEEAVKVAATAIGIAQSNLQDQRARRIPSAEAEAQQLSAATRNADQAQRALSQSLQPRATVLTAPFDGVVTSISTQAGEDIGDSGLLTLDSSQLEMRAQVSEADAQKLSVGQQAALSAFGTPESTFNGKIAQVGAAVDPSNQMVAVDVVPDAPPDWLRPGENLNATVELSSPVHVLVVPASSVIKTGDSSAVFVMKNGRAVEKKVVTNPPNNDQGVPVVSGLDANDRVVQTAQGIKPGERIKEGDRSEAGGSESGS
jgi:HlyD family secretion protein